MSNYRRVFEAGGQYFFTVNFRDRRNDLLTRHIKAFNVIYDDIALRHPFETLAICILPEHLHCIWQLPEGDSDYPKRWRLIKSGFTRHIKKTGFLQPVWQNRYWEHHIRDEADLANHIDYIHGNPIKHGYVQNLKDWPHSSWHKADKIIREELANNRAKWDRVNWGER
mgnify:CR=1 FL=1